MKRPMYWYIGNLPPLTNNCTTALTHKTSFKESVVFSLFNRAYFFITNKDDLNEDNTRLNNVLKENGYEESILSKTACLDYNKKRKPGILKRKRPEQV